MEKRKPTIKGVLKYGSAGLIASVYSIDNSRKLADIVVSKDNRKIFEFFDLDFDRYLKGFDTLEEIFEFIISSKYFNINNFLMENLSHIDRKRNKKRKTYKGFLDYVKNKKSLKSSSFEFSKNKEDYIDMINNYFPESNLLERFKVLKIEDERNQRISKKFNGYLVMELTGLKGKELGSCMTEFKKYISELGYDFKEWVDKNDSNYITNFVKEWYNKHYENK